MSKPVVIEVTRGPVVESRHEGIAAIVQPDGTVVASWGDIDSLILPRSANKPIQAMAFVESGAVEKFGLGNEHIALACGHSEEHECPPAARRQKLHPDGCAPASGRTSCGGASRKAMASIAGSTTPAFNGGWGRSASTRPRRSASKPTATSR